MGSEEESGSKHRSSKHHHHQRHTKKTRKNEEEDEEERYPPHQDLRNKLNELKQKQEREVPEMKHHRSSRSHDHDAHYKTNNASVASSVHRTYHKERSVYVERGYVVETKARSEVRSSVVVKATGPPTGRSESKRGEKEAEKPKKAKLISDAEVNEVISEEEEKLSGDEAKSERGSQVESAEESEQEMEEVGESRSLDSSRSSGQVSSRKGEDTDQEQGRESTEEVEEVKTEENSGDSTDEEPKHKRQHRKHHKKKSKKVRRERSVSSEKKRSDEEETDVEEVEKEAESPVKEDEETEPELIEPETPEMEKPAQNPIVTYYCALQGCRSVEEFECLNRIEEGAYGVVFRAKDKKSNEVVALKRLKMEKEREGFPITSLREIDTLLKCQHPNVVTVREIVVGSNMDKIFMVMDYVEHDLKSLMQFSMKKPFMMSEVKTLMIQLLRGIAHLHHNWIIHRDLKTSNLLLSHKGVLKIADFGLAREYGSPLKEYTAVVVTLWYRSPELLLNTKLYSTAVDMWSVGCIFGELMLMKALFNGRNEKDQLEKIFKNLGTPTEKIWPEWKELPLAKQINFPNFPYNTLRSRFGSYLSDQGFQLINKFLTYDPSRRISAEEALKHDFFKETPLPIEPSMFPTWPAKSEGMAKAKLSKDSEPRAPSAGKMYEKLVAEDEGFVLQFPKQPTGFTLR